MDEDANLVPQEDSNAMVKDNGALICDLRVDDGEVHLPQRKKLDLHSPNPEYEKEFIQSVPDDVQDEVRAVLKAKRRSFSPLQIIAIVFFIALAVFGMYCYYPFQTVVKRAEISRVGLKCSERVYKNKCSDAVDAYEEKDYRKAIEILEKDALEISRNPAKVRANGMLLGIYFNAVEKTSGYDLKVPREIIEKVIEAEPDRLGWQLDDLWLRFPECRTNDKVEDSKRTKEYFFLVEHRQYLDSEDWREIKVDSKENRAVLDLYLARRYFRRWLYDNPKKNLDLGDSGVWERERAYDLVKRYTGEGDFHLPFADLGVKILDAILDAGIGLSEGGYCFDGRKLFLSEHVVQAKKDLQAKYERKKKESEGR